MVAEVDMRTIDVFTGKVTLLLPAGTVTLEGTLAAALLLESVTCAPPAGAGPLSVTVPVDDCVPPVTLVGFNVSEETVGRGGGIKVGGAHVCTPATLEERMAGAGWATTPGVIVKVAGGVVGRTLPPGR